MVLSDFVLNVLDVQSGIQVDWSDLQTKLTSLNLSITDVKRVTVSITDIDTDSTNVAGTAIKHYYPLPSAYIFIVPNADLVYGDHYDVKVQVKLNDNSILYSNIERKFFSQPPETPTGFVVPQSKSLVLKLTDMTSDRWGSTPLSKISIDLYTYGDGNNTIFNHIILDVNNPSIHKDMTTNTWSYIITGLQNLTIYELQVKLENETKESDDLDLVGTPSRVSQPPQNLTVQPSESQQLALEWEAPADAVEDGYSIDEYWIYRSTVDDTNTFVKIDTVNGSVLNYVDSGLSNGTTYFYRIAAALIPDEDAGETDVIQPLNDGYNVSLQTSSVSSLCFDTSVIAPSFTVTGADGKLMFTLTQPSQNTGKAFTSADYFKISYYDGSSELTQDVPRSTSTVNYQLPSLVNGLTYTLKVKFVQNYVNNNGGFSETFEQDYEGAYSETQLRTPYSSVPAVENLVSTPVDSDENVTPLSSGDDGALRLSWDKVMYDVVDADNNTLGAFQDDIRYTVSMLVNSAPLSIYSNPIQQKNVNATGTEFATMYFTAENNYKVVSVVSSFASVSMVTSNQQITATIKDLLGNDVQSVTTGVVVGPNGGNGVFSFGGNATLVSGTVYRVVYTSPVQLYEMVGQQGGYNTTMNGYSFSYEEILTDIQASESDRVVVDISGLDLGRAYELYVNTYYLNDEEDQVKTSTLVSVGPTETTTPFNYPTNGSNLQLAGGDGIVNATWDNTADVKGRDAIYYQLVVKQDGEVVQTIDELAFANNYEITGLNNGYTYTVELSSYTKYNNVRYYSNEGGYADLVATITPFGPLDTPQGLSSTPIEVDNTPLSSSDNGKLRLSWNRMDLPGIWSSALRYKVEIDGDLYEDDIQNGQDLSTVTFEVSGLVLGQQYLVKVLAYFVNEETNATYSSSYAEIMPGTSTQPFYYPTNGSNLSAVAGDTVINVSWTDSAHANGGYDLRYQLVVLDGETDVQTIDDLTGSSYQVTGLNNGITYNVVLSSYTTYLGERYYSNGALRSFSDQSVLITPYSSPSAPSDFISTPVDEENQPLSTKENGKLYLSWTNVEHDLVDGLPSKWTNSIRYRILNENNNVLGTYDHLNSTDVLVQDLLLGVSRQLKVQAFFYNEEIDENIYGAISSALNEHNSPFAIPDDVVSLTSIPSDESIEFSWVSGNGRGLTPKFETISHNANELNVSSPYVINNLTNGTLYGLWVKTYTEYTPRGESSPIKYYASLDGIQKQEIPRRPASVVRNLVAYPQKTKFAATFDAPLDLGGAVLDHYEYSIYNVTDGAYVNSAGAAGDSVTKESELVVRDPLVSNKQYELKVWAVTKIAGPEGVTIDLDIDGQEAEKDFSYFVSSPNVDPDVHDLQVTPGDGQLLVTFGYNYPLDNSDYEIILYKVDSQNNIIEDLGRVKGPSSESNPVDGVVQETLTGLTNGQKYHVVVLVSTLDSSANKVYDSDSKYGVPTNVIPGAVQNLTASNGDDSETTVTFDAPSNEEDMPDSLFYQVVNKDEWDLLLNGIVNDEKANLTGEVIDASNDVVYTTMVRAYYVDEEQNRVYGPFSTVQSLPLPEPELISNVSFTPGDKEVVISWTNVSESDDVVFPKSELKVYVRDIWPTQGSFALLTTISSDGGVITQSSLTHNQFNDNDIENGKKYEYKFVLNNNKSVTSTDSDAVNLNNELVPSSDNSTEYCPSVEAEETRPFHRPIVSGESLNYNGSSTAFTINVSHNGRYVREVLIVGVPTNDALARDQDIMVVQRHYDFDSETDVLASSSYQETATFPYTVKSVLYIVENEAGNTVDTFANPSL